MKNSKLLTLLAFVGLVAFGSTNAIAQETADVEVAAEVLQALTLGTTDIDFGGVQNNTPSTLDPDGDNADANVAITGSLTRGQIDISNGVFNAVLDVTCTDATLGRSGGAETIAFTTSAEVADSPLNCAGDTITLSGTGTATINIGGSLAAATVADTYSTTLGSGSAITFTFSYQ